MASKRKRKRAALRREARRQAAAIEEKPITTTQVVSRVLKDYRVATQKNINAPIYVITIRESDPSELINFVCRIYEVKDKSDFAFIEIHHHRGDGGIEVICDGGDWPRGVKTIHNEGLVVRGKSRPLEVKKSAASTKPATPAATPVVTPLPTEITIKFKRYKTSHLPSTSVMVNAYGQG